MRENDTTTGTGTGTGNQQQTHTFGVAPALVSGKVQDGRDYILIERTRQGEQPRIWSTGDQAFTQQLLQQVAGEVEPV
jgi:hypothetical protein